MEACQGKVDWSIRRKTTNHTGRQSGEGFLRRNDWFSVAVCVSGKMIWATKLKSHCQRLLHCYGVSNCSWRACIYLCTGGSSSNQSETAHPRHGQWIGASCVMCTVSDWVQSLVDCWTGSLEYLFTVAKFVTHTETIGIFFFNLATGSIEDCFMRTLHSCHVLFIMQNFTLWLSRGHMWSLFTIFTIPWENIWPPPRAFWADSSLIKHTGSVQQEREFSQRASS